MNICQGLNIESYEEQPAFSYLNKSLCDVMILCTAFCACELAISHPLVPTSILVHIWHVGILLKLQTSQMQSPPQNLGVMWASHKLSEVLSHPADAVWDVTRKQAQTQPLT